MTFPAGVKALIDVIHADVKAALANVGSGTADPSHTHPVPVATQEQAEAGTAADVVMTPERTKQAIEALAPDPGTGAGGGGGGGFLSAVQTTNSAAVNLNTTSATAVDMAVVTAFGATADFTAAAGRVTCNFNGTVRVSGQFYSEANVVRTAYSTQLHLNDVPIGPKSNSSYIRNTSGHNEGSNANPARLVTVSDGDILDYRSQRQASAGTCSSAAGMSEMLVERIA